MISLTRVHLKVRSGKDFSFGYFRKFQEEFLNNPSFILMTRDALTVRLCLF